MITRTTMLLVAAAAVGSILVAAPAGAAPFNDSFDRAARVSILPFKQVLVPASATLEAGEPSPSCSIAAGSVWYRLDLDAPVPVAVFGDGNSAGTFLAVWEGDSLSALQERACDDDVWGTEPSQVSFIASPGAVYYVQVGPTWGAAEIAEPLGITLSRGSVVGASTDRDGAEAGVAASDGAAVRGGAHVDRVAVDLEADLDVGQVSAEGCARAWHAGTCTTTP